jgi:restriction system protein
MDINITELLLSSFVSGFISVIPSLWPIGLLVLFTFLIKLIPAVTRQQKYNKAGLSEIDEMTGEAFEKYLVALFTKLGYQAEHIGKLGDYGGDLILTKDGLRTLVQAKRQKSKVKESAVQQALAAKAYYHCDRAMVVTNNYYYWHAWNLGKKTNTVLWTRKDLAEAILKASSINMLPD